MGKILNKLGIWNAPSIGGLAHLIAGVVTILSFQICFILPAILYLGFRDYELNEEGHIGDMAFKDIQEFMIGLFVGTIALLLFGGF